MTAERRTRSAAESPGDITRRELYFFNLYRCLEAVVYAGLVFSPYAGEWVKVTRPLLGQITAAIYLVVAILLLLGTDRLRPRLVGSISGSLVIDIATASLVLIALAVNVGIAALLLPRRAFLFAALAALGVVIPFAYAQLVGEGTQHPTTETISIIVAYFVAGALAMPLAAVAAASSTSARSSAISACSSSPNRSR